ILLAVLTCGAVAQTGGTQPTNPVQQPAVQQPAVQQPAVQQPAVQQPAVQSPPVQPKVIGLEGHLEADVLIRVKGDHLAEWAANPANNPAKLVPYMNGLALTANYPEEIHASKNHLHYHLQITQENKSVWIDLMGAPTSVKLPVDFSVGLENHSQFDSVFEGNNR